MTGNLKLGICAKWLSLWSLCG